MAYVHIVNINIVYYGMIDCSMVRCTTDSFIQLYNYVNNNLTVYEYSKQLLSSYCIRIVLYTGCNKVGDYSIISRVVRDTEMMRTVLIRFVVKVWQFFFKMANAKWWNFNFIDVFFSTYWEILWFLILGEPQSPNDWK